MKKRISHKKKFLFYKMLTYSHLFFIIFLSTASFAQGTISKQKDGSVKGSMELMPCEKMSGKLQHVPSPYPKKTDPMLDQYNWQYSRDKKVAIRGFVKEAAMLFEWWTLLGDPIERYAFKWLTTGYYEVQYEDKGQIVTRSINRSQLAKYPDLLKKFDQIEPQNVSMELTFNSGDIDDQAYYNFRRKNNISTDLGSAGYKSGPYTIKCDGVQYLYGPSGENPPFIIPTMALGGWPDWLNITDKDKDRLKTNLAIFRLGRVINFHTFKLTDLNWPFGTFVEIVKQYDRYEKKEATPKELAENAPLGSKADGGDDFWNKPEVLNMDMEVYRDPTNNKYGLKAKSGLRALPAVYNSLEPSTQKGIYLGTRDNKVIAVNSMGKEVASISNARIVQGQALVQTSQEDVDGDNCKSYIIKYEVYSFSGGSFQQQAKLYSVGSQSNMSLIVTRDGEKRDYEAERRAAEARKRRDEECTRKKQNAISRISGTHTAYGSYFK